MLPQNMCASTNVTSHTHTHTPTPPSVDKSPLLLLLLSPVSVWREQPNNSVFLSSSWKSTCSRFVLYKAAITESRRTARGFHRCSRPSSRFLSGCCETWRRKRGDRARPVRDGVVCLRPSLLRPLTSPKASVSLQLVLCAATSDSAGAPGEQAVTSVNRLFFG